MVPLFSSRFNQRFEYSDGGVIDQDVQATKALDRVSDQRNNLCLAGDISGEANRLAAKGLDLRLNSLQLSLGSGSQRHPRSAASQGQRDAPANAATGAGYDGNFPFEWFIVH
jgi:hypothetical protein